MSKVLLFREQVSTFLRRGVRKAATHIRRIGKKTSEAALAGSPPVLHIFIPAKPETEIVIHGLAVGYVRLF